MEVEAGGLGVEVGVVTEGVDVDVSRMGIVVGAGTTDSGPGIKTKGIGVTGTAETRPGDGVAVEMEATAEVEEGVFVTVCCAIVGSDVEAGACGVPDVRYCAKYVENGLTPEAPNMITVRAKLNSMNRMTQRLDARLRLRPLRRRCGRGRRSLLTLRLSSLSFRASDLALAFSTASLYSPHSALLPPWAMRLSPQAFRSMCSLFPLLRPRLLRGGIPHNSVSATTNRINDKRRVLIRRPLGHGGSILW